VSKKSTTAVEKKSEATKAKTKGTGRTAKSTATKTEKTPAKKTKTEKTPEKKAKAEKAKTEKAKAEKVEQNVAEEKVTPVKEKKSTATRSRAKKTVSEETAVVRKKQPALPELHGVKIIPLGGLEQIGMNITAYEYEDSIIVVDCGLAFPTEDMLGVDLVIPDVTYLKDNIDKVKGFVITHAHEDHIGSLPYILPQVNVPIYATKLTMGIIENKLKEHNLVKTTKRKVIKHGQSINLGCFRIEFIRTNHSIADSAAFAIYTPVGTIIHTGDFKVDYTPVFGDTFDLQRLGEIGKKGVLALLADSTNVERPGFTMSERTVGKTFDNLFAENTAHRIIVATFASNVDRVQQIINSAIKYDRKVVIEGRSMVNIITTANELGYINIPNNLMIDIDQIKNYPPEKVVLITTGSQGEAMAALSRMAGGIHKRCPLCRAIRLF